MVSAPQSHTITEYFALMCHLAEMSWNDTTVFPPHTAPWRGLLLQRGTSASSPDIKLTAHSRLINTD